MAGVQGRVILEEGGRWHCKDNTQGRPQFQNFYIVIIFTVYLQFYRFPGFKCSHASSVVAPLAAGGDRAVRVVRRFLASKDPLLQLQAAAKNYE